MQVLSRWHNVMIMKNSIIQSTKPRHSASFHSTNALFEKWRNKFDSDAKGGKQQTKNYIRYEVRQKRANTKKAITNILFKGGCSTSKAESFPRIEADYAEQLNKKSRVKPHQAKRAQGKKSKRKHQRENMFENFDDNMDRMFHAAFGENGFTWTFRPSGIPFDETENLDWKNYRSDRQDSESRKGFCDNSFAVGLFADRKVLGLPTYGPLKIEDVKAAFRLSALKWHPDKHQGFSKADAENKFKLCVEAYRSLCDSLSTT